MIVFIEIVKIHICHGDIQLLAIDQSTGAKRTVFKKLNRDGVFFLKLICNPWKEYGADHRRNSDPQPAVQR